MRQNAILLLTILGISIWFFSKPQNNPSKIHRGIASQHEFDADDGEEEYDFYESVNTKKSQDAKPVLENKLNGKPKEQKAPTQNPPKAIDTLEDSEFSKLDINRLIKLCQFGDRAACHKSGTKILATDPKSLQAAKLLARGCSLKSFEDCHQVGEILKNSHGSRRALPYFKAACEQASLPDSCFETATITSEKSQTAAEIEKTKEYFNIACLEGNAKGCLSLATFYANNWSKHQYYINEACKLDPSTDSRQCHQQIAN